MKEEYKDFIGIYDKSVPIQLCDQFVDNWEEAQKNKTIIDCSKENETGRQDTQHSIGKKDEAAFIGPLFSSIYPLPPVQAYFSFLSECFDSYLKHYSIVFNGTLYNDIFKIHKVRKSEGFHAWHYERMDALGLDRMMVYMTYLESPKKGGETEFLHQSLRIDPIVGRTLIWPAGFTHMHRGNPPLEGEKMYITGWFNCAKIELKSPDGMSGDYGL
jgi:hypothetical protein